MFICCITGGGYWDEKIWELYLQHSHDWWQSGSVRCVCRFPKEQAWCAWDRGLSFHVPSGVLGFPLTVRPGLLPSCSVSFPSAAETSPGKCSEGNLLSCLSSWRDTSPIISDPSGISFLLILTFWTWKQCHEAILVTLHLSSFFPPFCFCKGNVKGTGAECRIWYIS